MARGETPAAALLSRLNRSQRDAVTTFLRADSDLQLLQGPPGTGKTTALVALLAGLLEEAAQRKARDRRVMVCAPSNRAVHEVLQRFLLQRPNAPAVLVGDADKLPEYDWLADESRPPDGEAFLQTWTVRDVFV